MTIVELKRYCNFYLSAVYDVGELQCVVYRLLEDVYGVTRRDLLLDENRVIDVDMSVLDKTLERVSSGEPLQYIIGFENFGGNDFKVDKSVLIPRPETQELVEMIISRHKDSGLVRILDIGTGSGAIAITLAQNLSSEVVAWDVSDDAIATALCNCRDLSVSNVTIEKVDVLGREELGRCYDIVVSNPPYITNSEKALMQSNVLDYEPHLALFVDDNEPLIFYKKIAELSLQGLKSGGRLYFEINEAFGTQMCDMLLSYGYEQVELLNDFRDKPRFVTAVYVGR